MQGQSGKEEFTPLEEKMAQKSIRHAFWERVLAFGVDAAFLGAVGFLLGLLFFDALAQLGVWGRSIGFAISVLYFGVLNSVVAGGQTLGKRLFQIRVVDREGRPLPLYRAMLRAGVLTIPFFLNGTPLTSIWYRTNVTGPFLVWRLEALPVFAVALAIVYLFLWNEKTRQSLHDLAAASYVIPALPEAEPSTMPVWRGHYIALGGIFSLLLIYGGLGRAFFGEHLNLALNASQRASGVGGVQGIRQATVLTAYSPRGSDIFGQRHNWLRIEAVTSSKSVSHEALSHSMARRVLADESLPSSVDFLEIATFYGYDIGIAFGWTELGTVRAPLAEWASRIAS